MKRTNTFFALLALVTLTIFGCQKDNPVTPQKNDSSATTDLLIPLTPETRLFLNPTSIEGLDHKLPAFDLDQFRATYRKVSIFERFEIEEEDMIYFMDDDEQADSRSTVTLPAGSVDGLAAAIAQAGEGGKVIVATGTHYESARVVITEKVKIIGQSGAVIETTVSGFMPVLHVKNTEDVKIQGLEMVAASSPAFTAILVENSEDTKIHNNTILGYDYPILNEEGEDTQITENTIVGSGLGHCIININGEDVKILGNDASNGVFGVFLCDKDGQYKYNTTHGNGFGLVLCKVPANAVPLPDGGFTGAHTAAAEWNVKNNDSHNNALEGYLVIDGANDNTLKQNSASGNGTYDIQLQGDSYRFGFFTPAAFDNEVKAYNYMTVKDCGDDNDVDGGIEVDTNLDPCN